MFKTFILAALKSEKWANKMSKALWDTLYLNTEDRINLMTFKKNIIKMSMLKKNIEYRTMSNGEIYLFVLLGLVIY